MSIGRETREMAVVAQPVGGGGVASASESLLAIEQLHPPCALPFQPVDGAPNRLDVDTQLHGRNCARIVLRQHPKTLLDVGHCRVKHLFDFIRSRIRERTPLTPIRREIVRPRRCAQSSP